MDIELNHGSSNPLLAVPRELLDPATLHRAKREPGGDTALVDCLWCGGQHRHHVRPGRAFYSKLSHCDVFAELFNPHLHSLFFYLVGEISRAEALHLWRHRNFLVMLADYER